MSYNIVLTTAEDIVAVVDAVIAKGSEAAKDFIAEFTGIATDDQVLKALQMACELQSTILGMSAILHDNALSEFAEITKKITERKTLLKVNRFIVALGGHEYFSSASKRLISIYLRWMKDFEKYIPATMLSLGGVADKLNRDSFGIATTSFEDMKAFYADSYELILDFVDVAIGLNNIAVRGDYNLFPTDSVKGRKKKQVGTFEEYRELIKSAKLDFLMDNEPF